MDKTSTAASSSHLPSRALGLALVATVFGLPFLYCLGSALQGTLFVGRYAYFGTDPAPSSLSAWLVVSALGSLWLGISLQVGLFARLHERPRRALVSGLILIGVTLLLFGVRVLSLRWIA